MPNARQIATWATIASAFLVTWEGTDLVAKPDRLAYDLTTFCNGLTARDDDPTVKPGDRFTPAECHERLIKALPRYEKPLEKCVHGTPSQHALASFVSGSYNAGPGAMCKSPMVKAFNAGEPDFCDHFIGWHEFAGGQWRKGLHNRRVAERKLCMTEG